MGRSRRRGSGPGVRVRACLLAVSLGTLLAGWILAAVHLLLLTDGGDVPVAVVGGVSGGGSLRRPAPALPSDETAAAASASASAVMEGRSADREPADEPAEIAERIVSRLAGVTALSDVRGNLGPASVVLQSPPGADWLRDRWQAASDMGGTAIKGRHWILLDFSGAVPEGKAVEASKVVLDWETAYAEDYAIETRMDDPSVEVRPDGSAKDTDGERSTGWCRLFDGADKNDASRRTTEESGQSPGVKARMPLHVVHAIEVDPPRRGRCGRFRYLRLYVRRGARPWGVSLWQLDVFGRVLEG